MLPSRGDSKGPCTSTWKEYQTILPTASDLRKWATVLAPTRWGVVTGELSNLVIVDFDGDEGREWLLKWKLQPQVRTGSGGYHVYFRHPGWRVPTMNAKTSQEWPFKGVDVRGDGGYAVVFGSNSSGEYSLVGGDIEPFPAEDFPAEILEYWKQKSKTEQPEAPLEHAPAGTRVPGETLVRRALQQPSSSGRNNGGFWLSTQLRDNQYSQSEAESWMREYCSRVPSTNARGQNEPYTWGEAEATLRSAYSQGPRTPWTPLQLRMQQQRVITGAAVAQEEPQVPEPDSVSTVDDLVAEIIASRDVARCYEPALIEALARAGDVKQFDAQAAFKKAFPKDFAGSIRRWKAHVKEAEERIREEQAEQVGEYITTENGSIRPILANAITAFAELDLAFDEFQQRVVLQKPSPWGPARAWSDDDDIASMEHIQRNGIYIENPRTVNAAARKVAMARVFHPVRNWLNDLVWDGSPRVDFWLSQYLGVTESALTMDFARMWMVSAVARIMNPGCKADHMLVFEAGQGARKSSALRMLVNGHLDAGKEPFWFRDHIPNVSNDDVGLFMQGVWVIEIAELDAIRRSTAWTAVKSFISKPADEFRRKYGINLQSFPRQCVFAGSTNEHEWMGDSTGGRRFWAVRVSSVDLEGLQRDREQLWAEAVHLYRSGCEWWLSEDQEIVAAKEIEYRMPEDVWTTKAMTAIDIVRRSPSEYEPGSVSVAGVLEELKIPLERQGQVEQNRIARILRSTGWTKYRGPLNGRGVRPYLYRKSD